MTKEQVRSWLASFGGRRFLMTMGAGVVHVGLLIGGYIDQATYQLLTLSTVAVYIGANTYQKVKGDGTG